MIEVVDLCERQQAVHSKVNVLVEAGAGTGKTTLIMERVVEAIRSGIPLSRILMITFMDKAQEEMRSRLKERLDTLPFTDLRKQKEVLDSSITTIHGFCRRLLSEFGAGFGIPLQFQVLDAVETDRLWLLAFNEWVSDSHQEGVILALLHAGIQWPQLVSWGRSVSDWAEVPTLHEEFPQLDQFLSHYGGDVGDYVRRAEIDAEPSDAGVQQIQEIARQFDFIVRMGPDEWPRMIAQWTAGLSPRGNKKNWGHPDWLSEQKVWIQNLRDDVKRLRERMADAYLAQWLELMRESFLPFWRRYRFDALSLTYEDLLVEAERVSRDPLVWEQLSQRYDLVMVDEFQDTDALQAKIIRRLVTPAEVDTLVPHDQGRLFLVGDPKQSIYRFRGADVETYVTVRDEIHRVGGDIIPIWQNFRSNPQILDMVNEIFSKSWPAQVDPERPYIPPFQPLEEAFPRDQMRRVAIEAATAEGSARDRRMDEANRIATLIGEAIGDGWQVRDGQGTRPITYSDVALIVPQRTGIELYRQALAAREIPVAAQSGRGFFLQDEIRGIRHLFRALENPEDASAVVGWLVSPWVALTYQELTQHRLLGGGWDYRQSEVGSPRILSWWKRLSYWHERFFYVDPETVIDWATSESSLGIALRERHDEAGLANLVLMRKLAREFGDKWGMDTFSQWLNQQVLGTAPFDEAKVTSQESEVTISTVHQAKGLEWPMVIVANWVPKKAKLQPGIHYNSRLKTVALRQDPWVSGAYSLLEADHRVREQAEGDRLLYVALTRARDYLWFFNTFIAEDEDNHARHWE